MVPTLSTHKHFQEVRHLPFCYLCGKPFVHGDDEDGDHIPPQSCFGKADRNVPLKLRTHRQCNGRYNLIDEQIGQVISLKRGYVPPVRNRRLAFKIFPPAGTRGAFGAITNVDIRGAIRRWVCGFHAALYREPIPDGAQFRIDTPFPTARLSWRGLELEPLRAQHRVMVEILKVNRAAHNPDELSRMGRTCHTYHGFDLLQW